MTSFRAFALASAGLVSVAASAYGQNAAPPADAPPGPPASTQPNAPGESANSGATAGDLIIVQARRRDERLQDVPVVVNAVTGTTLQKDNLREFTDITTVVPGLSLVPNPNTIGSSSSVRGVNDDVNVSGDNGTIQYYINDAPANADTVFQTLYDIDSIDVERGPQGTLRGRSTPSGSIAITTHQPNLEEPGAYVDGTIATHDIKNINFGIGVPIIKDILAVRVAGVYDFNRNNDVYSVNNPTPPSDERKSLRASVRFEPTDWLKTGFSFTTMQHQDIGYDQAVSFSLIDPTVVSGLVNPVPGFGTGSVFSTPGPTTASNYGTIGLGQRRSVETMPSNRQQSFKRYDWHLQVSFAGQNLIYVGSHEEFRYNVLTNLDYGALLPGYTYGQHTLTSEATTSHEVRLQNAERVAGMFDYVVGYFRQTTAPVTNLTQGALVGLTANATVPGLGAITAPIPSAYIPGGNPFVTNATIFLPLIRTVENSFYGNLTVHIGDHNEISGGVRHIQFRDPGQNLYVNGGLTSPAVPDNGNPTIYNVTARHRFSDELMVYASTGTSWRPGGHAVGDFSQAPFSPNEQAFTFTNPETSTNYEVGLKSELLDRKLLFDVTYYHQNFKNYPFRLAGNGTYYINYSSPTTPTVGNFNFISGVPVAVNGVEAELDYHPSRSFSIDNTINWSKSRVGNVNIPCDNLPYNQTPTLSELQAALPPGEHLGACSGAGLPANFQPNWSGTLTAEYDMQLRDQLVGFLRGVMPWRGASQNDPLNPYDNVGAYALFNAYLGIRDDKAGWSLMVYGKNLANLAKIQTLNGQPNSIGETVINTSTGYSSSSATLVSRYGTITVTPPREIGLNLRIALGSR